MRGRDRHDPQPRPHATLPLATLCRATLCRATLLLATLVLLVAPSLRAQDPEAWASPRPEQPEVVAVVGGTVWTSGPQGVLQGATVLVRRGKIVAVGRDVRVPAGALVVDASGRHVTAGLLDAHSHTAVEGPVNEGSHISTAEVRIQDVLNSEDINIYRQLAGGVTTIHVLHGSANAIGGQDAVIKLRWGAPPDDLLLDGAPPGIKFALGENPKRRGSAEQSPRYPRTRPGVEQVIRERFAAAVDYQRRLREAEAHPTKVPPRRDLELEALGEILAGKRLVHAHSYRHDEILMLLRVADDYGFRVGTLQHVLEGYKVANEIAAHGAGASTFSDWWGYKHEVLDAIPYNGSLMRERGVVVSFNSDSSELARRLNLEAAKAVRYGGTSEEDALLMVTLNPAIQLGLEERVGSLEEGKDADLVVWSGHPLSSLSRVDETWVDGRKYFDRQRDLERRVEMEEERRELIAKVAALKKKDEKKDGEGEGEDEASGDEPAAPESPPPGGPGAPPQAGSYRLWEDNYDEACLFHLAHGHQAHGHQEQAGNGRGAQEETP